MDAIDRLIQAEDYVMKTLGEEDTSWETFEQKIKGKHVFLFGMGAGVDLYYRRYGARATAEGIIDNDANLWGALAQEYVIDPFISCCHDIHIWDLASVLAKYPLSAVAVLITSLKAFPEIEEQLLKQGVKHVFSLARMEMQYRLRNGIKDVPDMRQEFLKQCYLHPLENKVLLIATNDCSGHGKEIARQLKAARPNLNIVWIVKNMHIKAPDGVKLLYYKNYKQVMQAKVSAKIWLTDTGLGNSFQKRQGQLFIQMKHWASITLKMFGFDEVQYRGESDYAIKNVFGVVFDNLDYVLVGSKFDEDSCRSGFRFSGEVEYVGSPRSDILFRGDAEYREVFEQYPSLRGKNLLLFAPTYRLVEKGKATETYHNDLDFHKVKKALETQFGGEWLILLRLHPFVANLSKDIEKPDYVVDVSDYYDSEELVAASDILITDYSSIMFEPAFVKKPVFLLASDRERYLREERGFLIDYDTLPFPIAESNEELGKNIEHFDVKKYEQKVEQFLEKYGVHEDGHAGERAAKFILDLIDGKRS